MRTQAQLIVHLATSRSVSGPCELICVAPDRAKAMWPHARSWIARAVEKTGDMTVESIEADVMSGISLLWIWWRDEVIAAAVTSLVQMPRFKICLIVAGGSDDLEGCIKEFPIIENYARAEQCDLIRLMGRRGWERKLPGFHQPWIVLDKMLKG